MSAAAAATLIALAACAGWTVAGAFSGVPQLYLAIVAGLVVVEMEAFRRVDAVREGLMAAGEMAGLLIVTGGTYFLVSLFVPIGVQAVVVGFGMAFIVWLLASITASDLEALVEPSDLVEGITGPADRLTSRFLFSGLGLTLSVVGAHRSWTPVAAPLSIEWAVVAPYIAYLLIGLGSLAAISRARHLARWERDGAHVDPDLRSRWSASAYLLIAAAVLACALLWFPADTILRGAHALSAWVVASVSGWLARLLNAERPVLQNVVFPTDGTLAELPEREPPVIVLPSSGMQILFLVVFALIFASAYLLLVRRSRKGRKSSFGIRRLASAIGSILSAIGSLLAGLWQAFVGLWRRPAQKADDPMPSSPRNLRAPWNPKDPFRRKIAQEYREFVKVAAGAIGSQQVTETPREYATRVVALLDDEPAVGQLSDLYAEARFSSHELSRSHSDQANEWRGKIVERLTEVDGGLGG